MLNAGLNSLLNFPSMVSASHCHRSLLVPIAAAIFVSVHGVFLLLKRQKEGKLYEIEGLVEWRPFTLSGI
ncbi:Protein LAZ1-like 1 isoform G [Glycine soja]|uniref:Protein LAZ1-like 1 isoform G n=1 Tax=Glycine soja TaxID=3848 RepID=A0A445K8L2_GLYSO|nr:Protein LAZ1-like 1 isoform G [Glycine soja]